MWQAWVIEGAKVVLTWALLEMFYGGFDIHDYESGGFCPAE